MSNQSTVNSRRDKEFWLQFVFVFLITMLLNLIIFNILTLTVITQAIMIVSMGRTSETVASFARSLAIVINESVAYITFETPTKPFPFRNWPDPAATTNADPEDPATTEPKAR